MPQSLCLAFDDVDQGRRALVANRFCNLAVTVGLTLTSDVDRRHRTEDVPATRHPNCPPLLKRELLAAVFVSLAVCLHLRKRVHVSDDDAIAPGRPTNPAVGEREDFVDQPCTKGCL